MRRHPPDKSGSEEKRSLGGTFGSFRKSAD